MRHGNAVGPVRRHDPRFPVTVGYGRRALDSKMGPSMGIVAALRDDAELGDGRRRSQCCLKVPALGRRVLKRLRCCDRWVVERGARVSWEDFAPDRG